ERPIRSCGLAPAKARTIHALSKLLVERHGGRVPASFEELETLPGVGHKTASVVMVQAFGQPAFPVDTHIHRLAARWGLSSGKSVVETERDLKKVFPASDWGAGHLHLISFGREHCPARAHEPAGCPICSWAAIGRWGASKGPPSPPRSAARRSRAAPRMPSRSSTGARGRRVRT